MTPYRLDRGDVRATWQSWHRNRSTV